MNGYEYLKKFLLHQDFSYEESDSILKFPISGVTYFAFKNESPYLQITIACKAPEVPRSRILELCNTMNQSKFVVKFTLTDSADSIWCNYELLPNHGMDHNAWMSIFRVLDTGSDELLEKMQDL